jgi:uncharacterized protein YjiK
MCLALAVALSLVWTASAVAQLSIVQQWPVTEFPGGVCYDSDRDHLWTVDDSGNTVREYTRIGAFVSSFPGSQVGLSLPIGMDFDAPSGNLWICDESAPEKVVETTRNGVLVSEFSVGNDMQDASGLAINTNNDHLYIADDNASEVVEWTKAGALVGRWSTSPNGDADSICYIAASNTLLVGDDNGADVYEFTVDGVLLNSWDMIAELGIAGVEGLSSDPATGNVFLGDSSSPRTIYEISGFVAATAVEDATWGSVKSLFR